MRYIESLVKCGSCGITLHLDECDPVIIYPLPQEHSNIEVLNICAECEGKLTYILGMEEVYAIN